jgi:hypothetical protein
VRIPFCSTWRPIRRGPLSRPIEPDCHLRAGWSTDTDAPARQPLAGMVNRRCCVCWPSSPTTAAGSSGACCTWRWPHVSELVGVRLHDLQVRDEAGQVMSSARQDAAVLPESVWRDLEDLGRRPADTRLFHAAAAFASDGLERVVLKAAQRAGLEGKSHPASCSWHPRARSWRACQPGAGDPRAGVSAPIKRRPGGLSVYR